MNWSAFLSSLLASFVGVSAGLLLKPLWEQVWVYLREKLMAREKYRLEMERLGAERLYHRFEACRTVLADVVHYRAALEVLLRRTPWDQINDRIDAEPRFIPYFPVSDKASQLDKTLREAQHLLPNDVIDMAIEYHTDVSELNETAKLFGSVTGFFDTLDSKQLGPRMADALERLKARKKDRLDTIREGARTCIDLGDRLIAKLDESCAMLAKSLREPYESTAKTRGVLDAARSTAAAGQASP
jgi:hypothetical protein